MNKSFIERRKFTRVGLRLPIAVEATYEGSPTQKVMGGRNYRY